MTAVDLLDQAVVLLKQTTVGYSGHPPSWQQNQTTKWWQGLDKIAQARALLTGGGGWAVAPPSGNVTTITNSANMALNLYQAPATLADYLIDGSGDSAVIVQPGAPNTHLSRFKILRACALADPAYLGSGGRHGIYGKAASLTLEDFEIECTPGLNVGQCFSLRMESAIVRRFRGSGAPHLIGYFEESSRAGSVLCEYGAGSFTGDTAVWLSESIQDRPFTFRKLDFSGASFFVKTGSGFLGTVLIDGCTLNGLPVTQAMTNVPAGRLTIT